MLLVINSTGLLTS